MFTVFLKIPGVYPEDLKIIEETKVEHILSLLKNEYEDQPGTVLVTSFEKNIIVKIKCEDFDQALIRVKLLHSTVETIEQILGFPTLIGYHIHQPLNGYDS